jgi:hypothetical protein
VSLIRIGTRHSNNFVAKKLVWILEGDLHNMVGLLPFVHSMFTTLLCCGGQVDHLAYLMYLLQHKAAFDPQYILYSIFDSFLVGLGRN